MLLHPGTRGRVTLPSPPLLHRCAAQRAGATSIGRSRMFSAIKRALGVGAPADACAGCDPAILAQCSAAEPGSVTPHSAHVFIKLAAPAGADPAAGDEAWWPESVDKQPAIEAVNAALKQAAGRIEGKVKVTAFDYLAPPAGAAAAATSCDLLIFPASRSWRGLPLDQLPAAVLATLAASSSCGGGGGGSEPEQQQQQQQDGGDGGAQLASSPPPPPPPVGEEVQGTTLFVCCHAARDERCGALGPPLAAKLAEMVEQKGLGGSVRVLKTSHVGGHKYAGNVLVYRRGQTCDGDWFGGLHTGNAAAFLDALLAAKAPSGAAGDAALRPWWRGRVGLSKEQQVAHFEAAVSDIEDLR